MIHIKPAKHVEDCILVNDKVLPIELYNEFKDKFTMDEQKAIENYLKK